jgi:hypothetical protein
MTDPMIAGIRKGQGDPAEDLPVRGAEVEGGFDEGEVEALQPGADEQHRIGGDERGLGQHGDEEAGGDVEALLPEDEGRDADDDAGRQDRRDQDRVDRGAQAPAQLVEHDGGAEPERHRQQDDEAADHQAVPRRMQQQAVLADGAEPAPGEAVPGQERRQPAVVEGDDGHQQQRQEQVGEEQADIGPQGPAREDGPGHDVTSCRRTRNRRRAAKTKARHSASSRKA